MTPQGVKSKNSLLMGQIFCISLTHPPTPNDDHVGLGTEQTDGCFLKRCVMLDESGYEKKRDGDTFLLENVCLLSPLCWLLLVVVLMVEIVQLLL